MLSKRTLIGAIGIGALIGFASPAAAQETYIPLISKGFQHQFWQAVKAGAEQAAKDYNVRITFEGPGQRDHGRQADRHALGGSGQEPESPRLRSSRQPGGNPAPAQSAIGQDSRHRLRFRRRQRHSGDHRFDEQPCGRGARRRQDGRADRRRGRRRPCGPRSDQPHRHRPARRLRQPGQGEIPEDQYREHPVWLRAIT